MSFIELATWPKQPVKQHHSKVKDANSKLQLIARLTPRLEARKFASLILAELELQLVFDIFGDA